MDSAFLLGSIAPDGSVLASALAVMGSLAMGLAIGVAVCLTRLHPQGSEAARGIGEDPAGTPHLPRR